MKFKVNRENLRREVIDPIMWKLGRGETESSIYESMPLEIELEGRLSECRNCRIDNVTAAIKGSSIRKYCSHSEKIWGEGFCSECGLRGTKELPLWKHDHREVPPKKICKHEFCKGCFNPECRASRCTKCWFDKSKIKKNEELGEGFWESEFWHMLEINEALAKHINGKRE